ncbi:DMT family transporter, partial [Planktotalea sp.]|uniref:DMT family transporter n=1 Tax=Planktotalea sp. TaxID=2029877 RepID=UPI003299BB14
IFIALVPVFSALLSGPVLGEPVRWQSWLALAASVLGMALLYPQGLSVLTWAHVCAFLGAFFGACSMVIARHISRDEDNALLQVLYPNLALCVVMGAVLPFVYTPMNMTELSLVFFYAVFLFAARWLLILALTRIKAYVVTLLINLQFVVMVVAGMVFFGETPSLNLLLGVGVIILASAYVFLEQYLRLIQDERIVLHREARSTAA